jgi:hypothetical protein
VVVEPPRVERARDPAANGGKLGNDHDHDGVCDSTELRYGGDLGRADSDRDGLPDLPELLAGFNPTDANSPGPDQVAFISGTSQTALDFEVRLTLDGSGQGYTGEFVAGSSLSDDLLSSADFFNGAVALGADPRENGREMIAASERFGSVDGRTRLSFRLSFAYMQADPAPCTTGYPFMYRIQADNGDLAAGRPYLLIVTSDEGSGGSAEFCVPSACL